MFFSLQDLEAQKWKKVLFQSACYKISQPIRGIPAETALSPPPHPSVSKRSNEFLPWVPIRLFRLLASSSAWYNKGELGNYFYLINNLTIICVSFFIWSLIESPSPTNMKIQRMWNEPHCNVSETEDKLCHKNVAFPLNRSQWSPCVVRACGDITDIRTESEDRGWVKGKFMLFTAS